MPAHLKRYPAILLVVILLPILLVFCQKKLFGRISVTGTVLHFFTKEPLPGMRVVLQADDVHSAKSLASNIQLAEAKTDAEGRFVIKSKPSKGDKYFLFVDDNTNIPSTSISIKGKGETDAGVFFAGTQDIYCRITLTSISQNCFFVRKPHSDEDIRIIAGTDTSFLLLNTYNSQQFNNNLVINYRIDNCGVPAGPMVKYNQEVIPIVSSDTLHFTVSY